MSISMWSYPWDLEDCGMAYALDDMKAHGIDGVSMITSYRQREPFSKHICLENQWISTDFCEKSARLS